MTADHLQRFIFRLITDVKKLPKTKQGKDSYTEAITDVIAILEKDRDEVINSYAKLKEFGLVV